MLLFCFYIKKESVSVYKVKKALPYWQYLLVFGVLKWLYVSFFHYQ